MLWIGVLACIIADIGWIISAFIVSRGIKEIKEGYSNIFNEKDLNGIQIELVMRYLSITLLIGFGALTIILIPVFYMNFGFFSWYIIPAGILLYGAGTALYYFCSVVYLRAEIASQFARVKPLFAIVFGIFIFNLTFELPQQISLILVCVGILLFLIITIKGKFGFLGLTLGFLTALSWAFGEVFINLAYRDMTIPAGDYQPYIFTYHGTLIGLISVVTVYLLLFVKNRGIKKERNLNLQPEHGKRWTIQKYFVAHGLLSIALGYTTNHIGIYFLGIAGAAVITSAWPILSLIIGYQFYFASEDREKYREKILWIVITAGILLAASIFYIF